MSNIDWSKAPEGATHCVTSGNTNMWYRHNGEGNRLSWRDEQQAWVPSNHYNVVDILGKSAVTPRPSQPKTYTRDEALQFLVERMDSWPTDIAGAPLCQGWGWVFNGNHPEFEELHPEDQSARWFIGIDSWHVARPDFVPFVSVEDAQPATAKQPAPSGKGDPILGMVLADLTNRALEGREKYGEALKANNGRNALRDEYQEALDLAMHLRQAIEEQSK